MNEKTYPALPGGGSYVWDETTQGWREVSPDEANAALDAAAGVKPAAPAKPTVKTKEADQ